MRLWFGDVHNGDIRVAVIIVVQDTFRLMETDIRQAVNHFRNEFLTGWMYFCKIVIIPVKYSSIVGQQKTVIWPAAYLCLVSMNVHDDNEQCVSILWLE